MIFNVSGGGGTALNFRVVGGTTAPSNPKENMIWVNTSTAITDWVFSATQPTAASGRVWISTGTSSPIEFNALKKNGIQVYPIFAKQYVSGAWVDKEAKSYQNGEWVAWWSKYLYNRGDECERYTGGWKATYEKNVARKDPIINSDHVYFTTTTTPSYLTTENKVNLAGITTLKATIEDMVHTTSSSSFFSVFIVNNIDPLTSGEDVAVKTFTSDTAELDVSQFNKEYYVCVGCGLNASGKFVELTWERG